MTLNVNETKRKKAKLCTYNLNNYVIIRYMNMLDGYDVVNIEMPGIKSWIDKDWSYLYMGEHVGKKFSDHNTADYEVAIFGDGTKEYIFSDLFKNVKRELASSKDICMLFKLSETHRAAIFELAKSYYRNVSFIDGMRIDLSKIENDKKHLYKMEVPVVFVVGTQEQSKKMDCVLGLKKYFDSKGYKVQAIGSKSFSALFDVHAFPDFMYDSISEENKILYFNALCKNIEYFEHPDIFIVGIPGGLMQYNSTVTNHFGILPYEISQALDPDYIVTVIPYGEYDRSFYNKVSSTVESRLGCANISYGMTNCFIDINLSRQDNQVRYCNVRYDDVERNIAECDNPKVYNLLSDNQINLIAEEIISKLSYS